MGDNVLSDDIYHILLIQSGSAIKILVHTCMHQYTYTLQVLRRQARAPQMSFAQSYSHASTVSKISKII